MNKYYTFYLIFFVIDEKSVLFTIILMSVFAFKHII